MARARCTIDQPMELQDPDLRILANIGELLLTQVPAMRQASLNYLVSRFGEEEAAESGGNAVAPRGKYQVKDYCRNCRKTVNVVVTYGKLYSPKETKCPHCGVIGCL